MPNVTIRGLSQETYEVLAARAAEHGSSIEAEVRAIVERDVLLGDRVRIGSLLAEIGIAAGGVDLDVERQTRPRESFSL